MFTDRLDAGRRLAGLLTPPPTDPTIVIGLPRSGIPVAAEVARQLRVPFDIRLTQKMRTSANPDLALGIITESGEVLVDRALVEQMRIDDGALARIRELNLQQIHAAETAMRGRMPRRSLRDNVVILVDDGVVTGSTLMAGVRMARKEGASRVVVAVAVGSPGALRRLRKVADEVICLATPEFLRAIEVYFDAFDPVTDAAVRALLEEAAARHAPSLS